tara:strand:+ start:175 stop:819 length:645 start_codon:yes stop_codon:yes gene_type:complete
MNEFINNYPFLYKSVFLIFAGFTIRYVLIIAGQRWANTYHHLGSYVLLPIISLVISSIIKDDIALSLGMIGALSIVRFRNPVKSPFELVMFFALVTLGVCAGVNINLCQKLFIMIVLIILGLKILDKLLTKLLNVSLFQYSFGDGNLSFSLEIETSEEMKVLNFHKGLISSYSDKKNNIYHYRIVFKNKIELNKFKDKISDIKSVNNIKADLQS